MLRGVSRFVLLFAILFLVVAGNLQAQPGTWAVSAGSKVQDYPEDVLVDDQGNVYVSGFFRDTIEFGAQTLNSAGETDIFIAKYDPAGQVEWARRFGWYENDFAYGMAFDTAGNVLLLGGYQDSTILDNDTIFSLDTLWYGPYAGTYDILVLTLDPQGNLLDHVDGGWFGSEYFYEVAVDSRNWKVFAGLFRTHNTFGGGLWGKGYDDAFMCVMDTANTFKWKVTASGRFIDKATSVDIVSDSLYVMGGTYQDTCWFRDSTLYALGNFEDNVFVSAWNADSSFQWVVTGGGPGKDHLDALEANAAGDIFVCGRFDSTFSLGSLSVNAQGALDGYIARISNGGNVVWLKAIGGLYFDAVTDLEFSDDGKLLVTGYFQGEVDFDGTLVSASDSLNQDVFVAAYDANGNLLWVRRGGGESLDKGNAIDVDAQGYVYVYGAFSGSAWFGQQRLDSRGSEDLFVIRMLSDGSVAQDPVHPQPSLGLRAWPNPADQVLNFSFELDRAEQVQIRLLDLQGRVVRTGLDGQRMRPGLNTFVMPVDGLQPGIYLYQIVAGAAQTTGKVSILH